MGNISSHFLKNISVGPNMEEKWYIRKAHKGAYSCIVICSVSYKFYLNEVGKLLIRLENQSTNERTQRRQYKYLTIKILRWYIETYA
jgi:hypothetical protein